MIRPFLQSLFLICLAHLLASCVGASSMAVLSSLKPEKVVANQGSDFSSKFASICLAGDGSVKKAVEVASTLGFETISTKQLQRKGLSKLEKKILKIPGGGGRYRETQSFMDLRENDHTLLLEERFARENLVSTQCQLLGENQLSAKNKPEKETPKGEEFLSVCTALGKSIGKAPDSNVKYGHAKGHFLKWDAAIDGKQASIACGQADNYPVDGYKGIVLSVSLLASTRPTPKI